jgi:hypothetical protein
MSISIPEARKILEASGVYYDDSIIEELRDNYAKWIDLAIDSYIQKINLNDKTNY